MSTFTLNPAQIAAIASLGAATPHSASDRQITPVLAAVQITVTPDTVTAVATDRYIVTELTFPLGDTVHTLEPGAPHVIMLDSKDWAAIAKASAVNPRGFVMLGTPDDDTHGNVTASWDYGQIIGEYRQITGNYPPVARLFPDEAGPLDTMPHIDPANLTRAMKAHTPNETRAKDRAGLKWQIAQTVGTSHKLAPLVLTAHTGSAYRLRSLLQPVTVRS